MGFPGAEPYDPDELLLVDCEILIPAATENVIRSQNADRVKCSNWRKGRMVRRRRRRKYSRGEESVCDSGHFWQMPEA